MMDTQRLSIREFEEKLSQMESVIQTRELNKNEHFRNRGDMFAATMNEHLSNVATMVDAVKESLGDAKKWDSVFSIMANQSSYARFTDDKILKLETPQDSKFNAYLIQAPKIDGPLYGVDVKSFVKNGRDYGIVFTDKEQYIDVKNTRKYDLIKNGAIQIDFSNDTSDYTARVMPNYSGLKLDAYNPAQADTMFFKNLENSGMYEYNARVQAVTEFVEAGGLEYSLATLAQQMEQELNIETDKNDLEMDFEEFESENELE